MNVLVTGGAGYIGCVLVPHLLKEGRNVTVLDRLDYGGEGLLKVHDHPGFRFIRGDIRDPAMTEESLDGVDVVIHLAALVGEKSCDRDPGETIDINYASVVRWLDAANTKLFMLASTCSIYGAAPGCLLDETSAIAPNSLYARTKAQAESAVLSYDNAVVMRFATVMGVSPRMRFDLLVNELVLDAVRGNLLIYGPDAWRPFVHVVDIARAIEHLVGRWEAGSPPPRVVNVGGTNITKGTLGKRVRSVVGCDLAVKHTDAKRDYKVDFTTMKQTGYKPSRSLTDAILEVYNVVQSGLLDPDDEKWRNA